MKVQELITENYEIILYGFLFIFGLFILAIRSYFTEKGKLKAQISENKKLIEQAESIKSKFSKELEELKKEHQLDISKRKYQYESKKEQYLKFFRLLDEFSNENNVKTQEKFLPILEEFNRNYLNATSKSNKKNETNAITIFSKKIQKLMFDANQDLIRIKQETNTIRLIASDEIIKKLDLLTLAYDKSMEVSNNTMNELLPLMLANNQEKMKINQREVEISGMVINKVKDEIIELMRKELNEI